MPVPQIQILLTPGAGSVAVNITSLLSQETAAELVSQIEDPTGTNNFMAGDVSLKGYDAPNGTTVRNYFAGITPTSTDYLVLILLALVPPGGSVSVSDVFFDGFVAPNTLQFEPRTGAFSFTVIGKARNLQTTSAASLFQRPGYFDGKWGLYADVSALDVYIPTAKIARVDGVAQSYPDFLPGDEIQFLDGDKVTIVHVFPDLATSPPAFWTLSLSAPVKKNYPASIGGVSSVVHLLTPYQRNLALHDVVSTLFSAAGFNGEQYFFSAALPSLSALFASPMNTTGLGAGAVSGIAAAAETGGTQIAVAGPGGAYLASSATSGFTLVSSAAGFKQPPLDATNYGAASTMFGPKKSRTLSGNPRYGMHETLKFYGYDRLAGNIRYVLTVEMNADQDVGPFPVSTSLASETCTAGVWVWGGTALIGGIGIATTTSTAPGDLEDAIGIDVDPATGTVFFTDPQLVGAAGTALTLATSSYQPGGAGYVANRALVNGPIVMTGPGRCVIFQVDGILGKNPTSNTFTLSAAGVMTGVWQNPIDPYVVGLSLKKNAGDGRYYALISNPTTGVFLASWATDSLIGDAGNPTTQISPPPPGPGNQPYDVDLAVQYGAAGVPRPMFALIGGAPVFISSAGSGFIPYADMTDLSVADALQQLSVIVAGFFYLTQQGTFVDLPSGNVRAIYLWNFRSRSSPKPGDTIGANDQIDGDQGFISVTSQPVYNKWVGYVSVQNENDETIFGDTSDAVPGSIAYANADGLNLQLKSRFVTSSSFATALAVSLYNYLGAKKRWVEVNRFRDGRQYQIGKTFRCNVDGVNRQFQIIESGTPMSSVTVEVVGLEV
jgi:hypothetical protein